MASDFDVATDRVFEGKQLRCGVGGQHAEVVQSGEVLVGNESPPGHLQVVDVLIVGRAADQPNLGLPREQTSCAPRFTHPDCTDECRDTVQNAVKVAACEAVLDEQARVTILVGRLDALDDDVGRTKLLDLLLSLVTDPFAQRNQPHDGGHTDQDTEHGQPGPELVQQQTLQAQSDRADEPADHYGELPACPPPCCC